MAARSNKLSLPAIPLQIKKLRNFGNSTPLARAMHFPKREAHDMARTQAANEPSDLRSPLAGRRLSPCFQFEAWIPSEIKAISPLVERLMRLIERSHCVPGEESAVELALDEALDNAVVHGNRMDRQKLVQVICRCESGRGISVVVKDEGQGFDPSAVPDPTAPDNIGLEHGRGIWLMKSVMDEVSFERAGTEVRMRKAPRSQAGTACEPPTK